MNGINQFYNGRSPAIAYILSGFLISIFLGLLALSTHSTAIELDYRIGFIKLDLRVILMSALGGFMTLAFLLFISLSIWRFFIANRSVTANITLVLGILHIPVSLLTLLFNVSSFLEGVSALLRDLG